jgi:hypothetical protein
LSLPRLRQLSLPRRSWLLRSFAAPATAGIRAFVAASFCEAQQTKSGFTQTRSTALSAGLLLTFESPCRGLIGAIEDAHLPAGTASSKRSIARDLNGRTREIAAGTYRFAQALGLCAAQGSMLSGDSWPPLPPLGHAGREAG